MYIEETILSVLNQNYQNLEFIVIDNCSTDETAKILQKYENRIDIVIIEPDTGQSNALNKGFQRATGEIMTWLNSDDMLAPNCLAHVAMSYLRSRPDMIVGSLLYLVGEQVGYEHITSVKPGVLPLGDLLDVENCWMRGKFFYQPEVFFKRSVFDELGGKVDESLYYSMDYDLWVRMAARGAIVDVVGAPFAIFRGHPAQKTSSPDRFLPELRAHSRALQEKYGIPARPPTEPLKPLRIAFVTDVPAGGAYLAHERLRMIVSDSGMITLKLELLPQWSAERPNVDLTDVYNQINSFKPDLVLIGNLHGIGNAVAILEMLSLNFQCAFYMHDMWLMTGRCAYNEGCRKFESRCDHHCPTWFQYPQENPENIQQMHLKKTKYQSLADFQILTNSSWMRDQLIRFHNINDLKISEKKPKSINPPCSVMPFLQTDRVKARKMLSISADVDVIVCSANNFADQRKGYTYVVDALLELKSLGRQPLVFFAGWCDHVLRKVLEVYGNCIFLGHLDPTLTPYIYAVADVLLSGSIGEAFGMTYVEAAAAGAVVVTFDSGGVKDSVCPDVSGMLASSFSGVALAACVSTVLDRKRLGSSMSNQARLWAESQHSDIQTLRKLNHFFSEIDVKRVLVEPKTQLYRTKSLQEYFAPKGSDLEMLDQRLMTMERIVFTPAGEIRYRIEIQHPAINFIVIRFNIFFYDDAIKKEKKIDFKILNHSGRAILDLRPYESVPPIYQHSFPVLMGPIVSDEWGPTLLLELGDLDALETIRCHLSSIEFAKLTDFFETVNVFLCSPTVTDHVGTALENANCSVTLSDVKRLLSAFIQRDLSEAAPHSVARHMHN